MRHKIPGTKFSRDAKTRAILCNDLTEKRKYEIELQKVKSDARRDEEINNLKRDISDIKEMLEALLSRGTDG
jgi:hypothetical protein